MEKILVNIDSRQRDISLFSQSNHFKLEYNDTINGVNFKNNNYINFKNVDYITLSSFEMMNNFYVFQTERYNVSFKAKPSYTGSLISNLTVDPQTVTINPGNYTYNELMNNLNKAMNNVGLNIGSYDVKGDFIVTNGLVFLVNEYTNTITLKNLTNNYTYEINFNNEQYDYVSLGYMLGYRGIEYTLTVANSLGDNIIGEAQADLDGENYLFLRINDYGSIYVSPKLPYKVLAKIVLNNTKQSFVFNNGQDLMFKTYKFRQPTDVKSLEIELLDYNGNRLNINGIDYSFTLEFGLIYDEELYKKKLFSLNLTADKPSSEMFNAYDDSSNLYSVETPSNKTATEIMETVFKNKVEIKQVDEMNEKDKKQKKKSKKNKFNIIY
jgi:hypothetical protein